MSSFASKVPRMAKD